MTLSSHAPRPSMLMRHSPSENLAAETVNDGYEIDEALLHRNLTDVGCPDLVGPLNRHLHHQGGDMLAANIDVLLPEQIAQHSTPGKAKLQMRFVHLPHDAEIGPRYLLRQVLNAASADPQFSGLPRQRQAVRTIDHRFALGNRPGWPSARDKKSFTSFSLPFLACSVFTSIAGSANSAILSAPKTPAGPFQKLGASGRELVRVNVVPLRQLGQRLIALHGSQCHLRLACRAVVPARSSALLSCGTMAAARQKIHLSSCAALPNDLFLSYVTVSCIEDLTALYASFQPTVICDNGAEVTG